MEKVRFCVCLSYFTVHSKFLFNSSFEQFLVNLQQFSASGSAISMRIWIQEVSYNWLRIHITEKKNRGYACP